MSALSTLKLNDVVSFQVYPVAILGGSFKEMVFKDRISPESARLFGADIYALWAQAYPTLPDGTVNDPEAHEWLTFKTASGELVILCSAWINDSTITTTTSRVYSILIGDGDSELPANARAALNAVGYYNITTTLVE